MRSPAIAPRPTLVVANDATAGGDRRSADRGLAPSARSRRWPCSAWGSSASANWRRSRARRWRCGSGPRSAGGSIRRSAGCVEPITPIAAPELIQVRRNFAEPIGAAETIARYVGLLVADLCTALEDRGLGARRLDLLCHRVDNRIEAVRIGTAKPVRDIKRLTRLLGERIETIDPGFGIERMTLSAPIAEPLDYRPAATSLSDPVLPDVAGLIDTLANRVGARPALPLRSRRKRRSRTLDPQGRTAGRTDQGPLAAALAATDAPVVAPRSRSRPWRCSPIIRRCSSPGAGSGAG